MLLAQANLYCSEADVQSLLSTVGELARLDDDGSMTVTTGSPGWLQAASYATSRVKFYCQQHYDDLELSTSPLVNDWATVIAANWLASRRGNPVPESLSRMLYGGDKDRGVIGDLEDVRAKRATIPEIGYRFQDKPAWSNVHVDARYRVRQIRVQRGNSERTPTQYPQNVDWASQSQEM